MDLNTITVEDFKEFFYRDFPYLPVWNNVDIYNTGDVSYYTPFKLFYVCSQNVTQGTAPQNPAVAPWLLQTPQQNVLNYVSDQDIERAFKEAQMVFNQSLFGDNEQIKQAYLYLTAHYLINDLRAGQRGINATGVYPVTSRSVGNVSEAYQVPDLFKNNAMLAFYMQSMYGQKYLSFLLPKLIGNVGIAFGATLP